MTSKIATLTEIQATWSLVDMVAAHEALDLIDEAKRPRKNEG